MKKLITYIRYLIEFLRFGDVVSIVASAKYLLNKTSHSKDRIIRTSVGTFFCRKNTNDFQFANYAYEWDVKKFILDHKNEFTVFIDGGACVGEYCILLANENLQCFAFEPIKNTFEVLLKNLELNKLRSKVMTFPFALGGESRQAHFTFNAVNTGASHIAKNNKSGDCKVEIRTFDSFISELLLKPDDRILFKLDLEGMEPEAIQGAKSFIQNYRNITFIIEEKHSGLDSIKETLEKIAPFEYGIVDKFNIYAKKINSESKFNIIC